jgi:hypothetical protein
MEETGPGFQLRKPTLGVNADLSIKAGLIPQITIKLW